jgi:acetyl esterase
MRITRLLMAILIGLLSAAIGAAAEALVKTPPEKTAALDYVGQLAAKLKPTRVVVYKQIGGRKLHLNIFEPEGHRATDHRACFLSIHGGGWTGLEPRRQYPFAAHFAQLGLVGISVEYRLAKPGSGTTVFDCVKDSRSAMRFVRTHAAELGVDPLKIVANGGSAGGHLAAGTALFDGVDEADDDTSVSCVPQALVLCFPVIDTSTSGYGNAKLGTRWQDLSPLHRVRPGAPPTIIFHGTGDTVTPYAGAEAFRDAMLKTGNRCELVTTAGAAHGYLMRDRSKYEEALRKTEAFLASLEFMKKK